MSTAGQTVLQALASDGISDDRPEKAIDAQDLLLRKMEQFFDKFITLQLILRHTVFNEEEAAYYCRIPVSSLRYHALRSRKLTFLEITKEGLVFLKTDLDKFLSDSRIKGYRDHS